MNELDLAQEIGRAALEKKASRLVIQDLRHRSDICDYQVICSGSSDRQTQAICNSIEDLVRQKLKQRPVAIEGKQTGHWILLDYGSVVVHVFLEEIRDYYALENLWPDVQSIPLEY